MDRQGVGGRRQEAGGRSRRQEAGGRRQEAGGRRQKAGGKREQVCTWGSELSWGQEVQLVWRCTGAVPGVGGGVQVRPAA